MKYQLPSHLLEKYVESKQNILQRLAEFAAVPKSDWFYEMCFCVCTPQSKAANAHQVELKLRQKQFRENPFNPVLILSDKSHYIRFHNQKAKNLLNMREKYPEIEALLDSNLTNAQKRLLLADTVTGIGMKESAHFMRNIGYRNLAILDRHILKHLASCGLFESIPKVSNRKDYLEVEKLFLQFSENVEIPMDELDLLFWSYETGEILK